MKNHLRKFNFTLVEVLIAMGICVVGVVSIMGLFPVGANTARDANMAFYADQTADQLLHLSKRAIQMGDLNGDDYNDAFPWFAGWPIELTNTQLDAVKNNPTTKKIFENPTQDDEPTNTTGIDDWGGSTLPAIYNSLLTNENFEAQYQGISYGTVGSFSLEHKIIRCVFKTDLNATDKAEDFDCIVHLWATPLYAEQDGGTRLQLAATLHAEVSWPSALPYNNRQKSEYTLDVFAP